MTGDYYDPLRQYAKPRFAPRTLKLVEWTGHLRREINTVSYYSGGPIHNAGGPHTIVTLILTNRVQRQHGDHVDIGVRYW